MRTEEPAMETCEFQEQLGRRCGIVLDLLRDAGADDLAARLTVVAAEAIYHDLVHLVVLAVGRWRTAPHQPGCSLADTDEARKMSTD